MASLHELIAQKDALEAEIERTRREERGAAVAKVREMMDAYGLTMADVSARSVPKPVGGRGGKGAKVAAKYRDASTGATWSGRGLQPKWLKAALSSGRSLGDFTI